MDNSKRFTFISLYNLQARGIRILCSILKDLGWVYHLLLLKDHKLLQDIEEKPPTPKEINLLVEQIKLLKSNFVGITVFSSFRNLASNISTKISSLGIPVIWGGVHPTIEPEDSIKVADIIFIGESEEIMKDFAEKISKGEDISSINGIWYRKGNRIYRNPLRESSENLDQYPFPTFDDKNIFLIENDKIIEYKENHKHYVLMKSRGCPNSCSFCSNAFLRKKFGSKNYFRSRSVQNCLQELEQITATYPISYIYIGDELFGFDKKWLEEFADKYRKRINIPFHCSSHPRIVNEELISLLKRAGVGHIQMGIQSGCERMLFDIFDRHTSKKTILNACKLIHKSGVPVGYDILLNNPYDTEKSLQETAKFLLEIPKPFMLQIFSLANLPATPLTCRMLKEGLIKESNIEGKFSGAYRFWISESNALRFFDKYWNGIINLCGSKLFPNSIIKALILMRFLKYFPQLVWRLVKVKDFFDRNWGERRTLGWSDHRIICRPAKLAALAEQKIFDQPIIRIPAEDLDYRDRIVRTFSDSWIIKGWAKSQYAYLIKTKYQPRLKNQLLIAVGTIYSGGLSLGLQAEEQWISVVNVWGKGTFSLILQIPKDDIYTVVLANYLMRFSRMNHFKIDKIGWIDEEKSFVKNIKYHQIILTNSADLIAHFSAIIIALDLFSP